MAAASRVILVPVLLLVLAACGSETEEPTTGDAPSTATSSSGPASDLPACDEVWVDGQKLPGGYEGCFDGSTEVAPDRRECSFGKPLVTYADEYYAVPGKVVNHVPEGLDSSDAYQSALAACTG